LKSEEQQILGRRPGAHDELWQEAGEEHGDLGTTG
jgi:hypothetical protein